MSCSNNKRKRDESPPLTQDDPITKILKFMQKHSYIKQDTPEWRELFLTTIGGSEIDILLKEQRNKARKRLLNEKRNSTNNFNINVIPCIWGTLFENVIRAY